MEDKKMEIKIDEEFLAEEIQAEEIQAEMLEKYVLVGKTIPAEKVRVLKELQKKLGIDTVDNKDNNFIEFDIEKVLLPSIDDNSCKVLRGAEKNDGFLESGEHGYGKITPTVNITNIATNIKISVLLTEVKKHNYFLGDATGKRIGESFSIGCTPEGIFITAYGLEYNYFIPYSVEKNKLIELDLIFAAGGKVIKGSINSINFEGSWESSGKVLEINRLLSASGKKMTGKIKVEILKITNKERE